MVLQRRLHLEQVLVERVVHAMRLAVHALELEPEHPAHEIVEVHTGIEDRTQRMRRIVVLPLQVGVRQPLRGGDRTDRAQAS